MKIERLPDPDVIVMFAGIVVTIANLRKRAI